MEKYYLYLMSLFVGCGGAFLISNIAYKWGLLDNPNGRSSHDSPTPKGGGIGILAVFILSSLFLKISPIFWISAAFLSLLSFFGDRFDLSPRLRLSFQFIVAICFLLFSSELPAPLNQVPFQGVQLGLPLTSVYSLLFTIFCMVFIVATANWYNFMDGINGIAGITGVVGFGLLAAFNFHYVWDSRIITLSICIALSCLGFLPFNFPKAKVFMGDVGSILLGFVFGGIVIVLSKTFLDFICLAGFLIPFYADEFITMSIRLKDQENLLKPHRRHFYQILANELGISHWKVSLGYGILQLVVGLSVLSTRQFGIYTVMSVLILFFGGFMWVNYAVRRSVVKRV